MPLFRGRRRSMALLCVDDDKNKNDKNESQQTITQLLALERKIDTPTF